MCRAHHKNITGRQEQGRALTICKKLKKSLRKTAKLVPCASPHIRPVLTPWLLLCAI